jgi:hypothetical protein
MKNYFLSVILLVIFSNLTTAQFNTGSKMVGASSSLDFGFFSDKYQGAVDATKYTTINISPRAAYFIQNRIAIGGDINFDLLRSKYDDEDAGTYTEFLIGPFARYYYKSVAMVRPFGELNFGIGVSEIGKIGPMYESHNVLYTGAGIGAAFFLAENFALEGMLSYTYEHMKNKEAEPDVRSNSHGITLNFGFSFFFNSLLQE